jgi:hypothetical protein
MLTDTFEYDEILSVNSISEMIAIFVDIDASGSLIQNLSSTFGAFKNFIDKFEELVTIAVGYFQVPSEELS